MFRWLYPAWFLVCALLFFALGGLDDPSRPKGRILSIHAGRRAAAIAAERGLRGYEVVHVARARRNEGAPEERWIVLLDKVPHTRLREAVVIELQAEDGALLRMRRPEGTRNEEHGTGNTERGTRNGGRGTRNGGRGTRNGGREVARDS